MLYRAIIAIAIIAFWLSMNSALVRLWLAPSATQLSAVPITHIVKQALANETVSQLSVIQNGRKIGHITLRPYDLNEKQLYQLAFYGNLFLELPFISQQPYTWRGYATFTPQFAINSLDLEIQIAFPKTHLIIEIDFPHNSAYWSLEQGSEPPVEERLALSKEGFSSVLTALGIDPVVLGQIAQSAQHAAAVNTSFHLTAQKDELVVGENRFQGYRLKLTQGGSTPLVEGEVSPVGQILSIKSAFGLQLQQDDPSVSQEEDNDATSSDSDPLPH